MASVGRVLDRLECGLRLRFSVDRRALAAFRIALGALVIANLLLRSRHLVAFYNDDGVLTRSTLAEVYPTARTLSLHAQLSGTWWIVLLFVLGGIAGLCLLVGYRSRLAALAISSITVGNAALLESGDNDRWQMFAPDPPDEAVWTTMGGTTASGAHVDAFPFREANVTADRPPDLADTYPNVRWGRYSLTIGELDERFERSLADYACRRWNATHDDPLLNVRVTQHVERVRLHDENPIHRKTLIEYDCTGVSGVSA